jgi:ParB/RepB/Spo0J family partition protein
MKRSLEKHGQLTPIVVLIRGKKIEVIDGFKRFAAAELLGWKTLKITIMVLDEKAQWVTLLLLNKSAGSMSVLEEALVLKEMLGVGLNQVEIGQLVGKHKSWVSRRVGLIERLHPELLNEIRLGQLDPGVARRLLPLPPDNQLRVAAAVRHAGMGAQETEKWMKLWNAASENEVKEYLLSHPREALIQARGKGEPATDPRLTSRGQALQRMLWILEGVLPRTTAQLPPCEADGAILQEELQSLRGHLSQAIDSLGCEKPYGSRGRSSVSGETG